MPLADTMSWTPRPARGLALLAALGSVWLQCGCRNTPHQVLAPLPASQLDLAGEPTPAIRHKPKRAPVDEVAEWACQGYRPWKYIVIHHSATQGGSAAEFDKDHRARGFDGLGYHFVITNGRGGEDGKIEVARRWRIQKWGAHTGGTPRNEHNNYGIGICLVGDFREVPPTPRQLASLRVLTAYLAGRFDIEPACIIGHRDAPDADTECPGTKLHRYIHSGLRAELARRPGLAGGEPIRKGQTK